MSVGALYIASAVQPMSPALSTEQQGDGVVFSASRRSPAPQGSAAVRGIATVVPMTGPVVPHDSAAVLMAGPAVPDDIAANPVLAATGTSPQAGIQTMPSLMTLMPAGVPSMPVGVPSISAGVALVPGRVPAMPAVIPSVPARKPSVPAGVPSAPAGDPTLPACVPSVPARDPSVPAEVTCMQAGEPPVQCLNPPAVCKLDPEGGGSHTPAGASPAPDSSVCKSCLECGGYTSRLHSSQP